MFSKARHLSWNNLKSLHIAYLKNENIYYTWKADGFLTKITLDQTHIYLKIYSDPVQFLVQEIEPINISQFNLDSKIINLSELIIFGECVNCSYFKKEVFLFDLKYPQKYSYQEKSKSLHKILNILQSNNKIKISIKVKEFSTNIVPYNQYYLPGDFEYEPKSFSKSDGIIIYHQNNCYKCKYVNTYDLWIENRSGKLFSEDNYFIGYLGPYSNYNYNFSNGNKFELIEVSKNQGINFYKFEKYRNDKKRGDTLNIIKSIDYINSYLLSQHQALKILRHIPKMNLNNSKLLTFEYRLLKEKTIESCLQMTNSNKLAINWLDIGCGNGHELISFLYIKSSVFKNKFNFSKSNIYLLDQNISISLEHLINKIKNNLDSINNIKIIKGDIYSSNLQYQIPKHSLDLITLFLSIDDFNQKLFRNLNYWLKSTGKIAIIFYDSTCIPSEGLFSIKYNFGLKHLSDKTISVYRNGQRKWVEEKKIDIELIKSKMAINNYKLIKIHNNISLDHQYQFSEMIWGVIFKREFENIPLFNILSEPLLQTNIMNYLSLDDYTNLQILFPQINWIVKKINYGSKQEDNILTTDLNNHIDIESENNNLNYNFSDLSDYYYNSSDFEYWS